MNIRYPCVVIMTLLCAGICHTATSVPAREPPESSDVVSYDMNGLLPQHDTCPVWTYHSNDSCKCGRNVGGIVDCDPNTLQTKVLGCYCMTNNINGTDLVVAACIFTCPVYPDYSVPQNASQLNDYTCMQHVTNREGQLCGQCKEGYAPPVYSYQLDCVPCSHGESNIVKYLAVSLLPLTAFIIIILVTGISATSPRMNAFILACQMFGNPIFMRVAAQNYEPSSDLPKPLLHMYSSVVGVWNLDFFRMVYKPFCLHHGMNSLQVLAMDYIIAIYPMFLTLIIFLLVKLYDREVTALVYLCRPFQWCTVCCRGQWNFRSSLIDTFVTFFVLSCTKLLSVSGDLLIFTQVQDMHGRRKGSFFLYYDGTVEYFGSHHLPYAILAITVLIVFVLFPLILLCVYPCRCFQRLLNHYQVRWLVLHTFMDNFQGCYKDGTNGTRDCRYFASMYLGMRAVIMLVYATSVGVISNTVAVFCLLLFSASFITVRPYKNDIFNIIDTLMIFTMVAALLAIPNTMITSTVHAMNVAMVVVQYIAAILMFALFPIAIVIHQVFLQTGTMRYFEMCSKLRMLATQRLRLTSAMEESLPNRLVSTTRYGSCSSDSEGLMAHRYP